MRRIALLLVAAALIPAFSITAQDTAYKPPRKWTFGSMGVALRADLTVYQGGARDEAGEIAIKEKDRLLKWGDMELKTLDDFCRCLYATKPGDVVEVEISRPIEGKDERETLTVKIKLGDPKVAYKELYTNLDKRKRAYDWRTNEALTKGGPLRNKLWPHIQKHKLEGEWDNLTAAHERELDLWDSYENLSSTDLLLSDPLSAHQWIRAVGDGFAGALGSEGALPDVSSRLVTLLDHEGLLHEPPTLPEPATTKKEAFTWWKRTGDAILNEAKVVELGKEHDGEGNDELIRRIDDFEFHWRGDPNFSESAVAVQSMRELELNTSKVLSAIPFVLEQLEKLALAYWESHINNGQLPIPAALDSSKFVEGDAAFFHTSYGLIGIGGPERNIWKGGQGAPIVILDVGGDDDYTDCASARLGGWISIVIDLKGNDRYNSTQKWGVATGVLGTAIIDDRNGNDTYECGDWGIGAAFGGIGLLIDRRGNDRYLGGSNSIGCAAYGIGGVIDLEGNDIYDSKTYSVGCGQPGGVGFVLDHSGDDRYRCTGGEPSPYGTEGEWFGGGIGCGFGWRTLACGGIGLVVDVKGNDIYDAGEFGLACGYFMGVGAVRDMDGDDIYHSSRYGLAAAAHAAVGVFMDDKGNDIYEGKTAASIGGVWDIATGYFYDGGGNDYYHCDGLGLGASAQNGFGIFWDAGGADVYSGAPSTIGNAGNAEYGGGRLAKNFGIFIDTGGGTDSYPRKDRKDNTEVVEQRYAIFFDE